MSNTDTPTLTHEVISYDVKQTAAALRKALKTAFPAVKFSVTMSRGTGYGWLDCGWTDGPSEKQVTAITEQFESSRWQGDERGYGNVEPTLLMNEDGGTVEHHYRCCGVETHHHISEAAYTWGEANMPDEFAENLNATYPHHTHPMCVRTWLLTEAVDLTEVTA